MQNSHKEHDTIVFEITCKKHFVFNTVLHFSEQYFNSLSANPEKWSNTLKQIVGNLPTICLSVFDHFMNLALKGLRHKTSLKIKQSCGCIKKYSVTNYFELQIK